MTASSSLRHSKVSGSACRAIGCVTFSPSAQGRGLAREALTAVIDRLFDEHGLHRVFAQADDRNQPVHRLLEHLGLRCEARLVEADWFKGEWTTLRVYAVLDREWGAEAAVSL
jgi:RimJ/RimL family protein N-acetyltransferase